MNKTCIFLFLITLPFLKTFTQVRSAISYADESFTVPIKNGKMFLDGTLRVSSNYKLDQPIILLIAPPQPCDRNYNGTFNKLSEILCSAGMSTLCYDNRAFSDSAKLPYDKDKYSMFDAASDVHDAFLALRRDKRFSKAPIGLLGHSEGGAVAAIENSRNKDISFLILLSTMGVQGADLAYNQMISSMSVILEQLPSKERNLLVSSLYTPIHLISTCSSNNVLKKKLIRNSKFDYLSTPTNEIKKRYGNRTKQQVIKDYLSTWMKPRLMAYFRFNPNLYYSKISNPVLIIYSKNDEKLDWVQNLNGLERIFLEKKKKNYSIIVKDSLNHSYESVKSTPPPSWMSRKNSETSRGSGFVRLCNSIVEWIKI